MNQINLKCSKCGGPITIENSKYVCLNCRKKTIFKKSNKVNPDSDKDQSKLKVLYS